MSELATDYMERALPLGERLQARLHLALCAACRAYFDQLAKTVRLIAESRPIESAREVEERVLRAVATNKDIER
jgi:predicted anti-sigma-YlaC factor YlaD